MIGWSSSAKFAGESSRSDNALWLKIVGSQGGVLCPECFDRRATALGFIVQWVPKPNDKALATARRTSIIVTMPFLARPSMMSTNSEPEGCSQQRVVLPLVDEALDVLTDVAQLLDGWHNDGTAWSEWDEQVRKRVSQLQTRLYDVKRQNDRISDRANHPRLYDQENINPKANPRFAASG